MGAKEQSKEGPDKSNNRLKVYLQEMRRQAENVFGEEEISKIVEKVRQDNYDEQ